VLPRPRAHDSGEDDGPLSSEMVEANTKLLDASKVDGEPEPTTRPKHQPALRKPLPEHLPRVGNVIRVPEAERACPECGTERDCTATT
jgi:transposase